MHESYLSTTSLGLQLLRETIISSLRLARDTRTGRQWIALAGQLLGQGHGDKSKVCLIFLIHSMLTIFSMQFIMV